MEWLDRIGRRFSILLGGSKFDRELDEEMAFHRALEAEEAERNGMPPSEAERAATRRLGNALLLREESREQWGWGWLDRLLADLRYAARMLVRNRGYTAAAAATLALAIGANCLMFSVADALVLRPLPYPHAERLALVWTEFNGRDRGYSSLPDFQDFKARNHAFESMGAAIVSSYETDGEGYPETLHGRRATADFFPTLGVHPQFGRAITPDDERLGAEPVIVISDHCWRTRFHADPRVLGSKVMLNSGSDPMRPYTIVGVLPPELEAAYPRYSEIWSAISPESEDGRARTMGGFEVLARLKPGVGMGAAAAEIRAIAAGLAGGHPRQKMTGAQLVPFQQNLVGDTSQYMKIMLGAVGFVLLLACANVANLALARGADREREMTIRAAIGAGRWRLFRQMLTESLLLACLGGVGGALLAFASVGWIKSLIPARALRADQVSVDTRVLLFTFALSLGAGLLFGLMPALRASGARLNPALQTVRGGARRHGRLRNTLVVAEVALGFVLVTGAGLMINSFLRLLRVDPGFERRELLLVETRVSRSVFPLERERAGAIGNLLAAVRGVPGVRLAGASDFRPLGNTMNAIARKDSDAGAPLAFTAESIAGEYLAAMGTPLLRGRLFLSRDGPASQPVAIVNAAAAARYWSGEDPIGRTLVLGTGNQRTLAQIVGVVGDVRRRGLDQPPDPTFYVPRAQRSFADHVDLVVRPEAGVAAAPLAPILRARMAGVHRSFSADSVMTMEALLSERLARPRFSATILGIFGFLALGLTVTGIYGVTSYTVRASRHEIGVRMALGADRRRVLGFVMGRASRAVALGLILGFAGAVGATRILERLLYGIKPMDAPTLAGVAVTLTVFAFIGTYIPARRATRVNPMESVRCD